MDCLIVVTLIISQVLKGTLVDNLKCPLIIFTVISNTCLPISNTCLPIFHMLKLFIYKVLYGNLPFGYKEQLNSPRQ